MGNLDEWVVSLRREIHREPETAFREVKTSMKAAGILRALGLEVVTGLAKTGVTGLMAGGLPGGTLALRADMDALAIDEKNDVPYRSSVPGIMHACGHDAHTAMLLGAAKHMVENGFREKIKGNVKFVFQPGEEGVRDMEAAYKAGIPGFEKVDTGAEVMIAEGVLDNPRADMAFACHVSNELECGEVGISAGAAFASSDRIRVVFKRRGCHAAQPDRGSDVIVAASHFITQLQSIVSRNVPPTEPAVISVGMIKGGTSGSVLPEEVLLEGTVRALREEVRQLMKRRIIQTACSIEKQFGLEGVSCEYMRGCPPCINDSKALDVLKRAAEKVSGAGKVKILKPAMLAEDFAYFANEVPSALFILGTGNRGKGIKGDLHSPFFDIDENALVHGVNIMVKTAEEFFGI